MKDKHPGKMSRTEGLFNKLAGFLSAFLQHPDFEAHQGPAVIRFLVSIGSSNGAGCLRGLRGL